MRKKRWLRAWVLIGGLCLGGTVRAAGDVPRHGTGDAPNGLGFKMLSHPSWRIEEEVNTITFYIDETPGDQVWATIHRSWEYPLTFDDLVPSALQDVYGYADNFFVARIRLNAAPALHIEAHPAGRPREYLLDYFLLHDRYLYRISFHAETVHNFRRYQMLFLKMVNSFRFVSPPAAGAPER